MAAIEAVQPEMLKACAPVVFSGDSEAVEIAVPDLLPIFEADPELERRLGGAHEVGLVDPEQPIVGDERGDRAFADADGSDRIGFDQRQLDRLPERPGNRGGRHPPRGAAAGDHDSAQWPAAHRDRLRSRLARIRPALSASSGARMPRRFSGT